MKIHAVGGYDEVGKNMTALEIGDDVLLFDSGLFLPAIVGVQEREKIPTERGMRGLGALPDDTYLDKIGLRKKVRALLISHAHLDHVGGVQYNAYRYNAPILGTPFTTEVLKLLMADNNHVLKNKIMPVHVNGSVNIQGIKNYRVEFLNMTHSTLQTAIIAVHTKEGIILYANDFKLDNTPILGDPPNYKRLKELAKIGVKALVVDCLYAPDDRKTPSEKIARGLLEDVFFTTDNHNSGMIVTTFSSHIARLKSIAEFGKRLNREVVFLGRSLNKYLTAARNVGKAPFIHEVRLANYRKQVEKMLKQINKNRKHYLIVCTGHQGEPGAILDRMSRGELPFKLNEEDHVIFSSKTIPTPINFETRGQLEKRLRKFHVRIFDEVHVSVLPNTEVVLNDSNGMKIKEIGQILEEEKGSIKVPAFDPSDLKIKWYNADLVKHSYSGKIFNIKTKSGRSVSITSGHSLFKLEKGLVVAEKGDNLKIGDYLAIPKKFSWHKEIDEISIEDYATFQGNNYKKENGILYYNNIPISNLQIKLTKEFARLLGYYLAEGSAPRHISLVINKNEKDLLKEIVSSIEKVFPSKVHIATRGNSCEITFGARILKQLFKNWFGNNAKTKKIPKFVFSASDEFKLNFLGAYINGDGCVDKGKQYFRIRIKTASEKLASDLLYIFSQVGICAKFDHVEFNKRRKIAGNEGYTEETHSYVIRIQNLHYLSILKEFLSDKFKSQIVDKLAKVKFAQKFPPEALPTEELNLREVEPKKGTYLYYIKNYNSNLIKKKLHISAELIKNQSLSIEGSTKKILEGDLLFDPIIGITSSDYEGPVYDFTVPGVENFIGGFGGIMLHNSGHGGKEDIRDLIKLTNPEHVIPSHGDFNKLSAGAGLAIEMGFKLNKNVHIMHNGQRIELK